MDINFDVFVVNTQSGKSEKINRFNESKIKKFYDYIKTTKKKSLYKFLCVCNNQVEMSISKSDNKYFFSSFPRQKMLHKTNCSFSGPGTEKRLGYRYEENNKIYYKTSIHGVVDNKNSRLSFCDAVSHMLWDGVDKYLKKTASARTAVSFDRFLYKYFLGISNNYYINNVCVNELITNKNNACTLKLVLLDTKKEIGKKDCLRLVEDINKKQLIDYDDLYYGVYRSNNSQYPIKINKKHFVAALRALKKNVADCFVLCALFEKGGTPRLLDVCIVPVEAE